MGIGPQNHACRAAVSRSHHGVARVALCETLQGSPWQTIGYLLATVLISITVIKDLRDLSLNVISYNQATATHF